MTSKEIPENVLVELGREPTEQEAALLADYTSSDGIAYKLNRVINKVNINNPIIIKAFSGFIERSGGNISSFRLIDLISFSESSSKGGFVYGNVGDYILSFSGIPRDAKLSKKIYRNSVNGMYELIDRTNGIALDITGFNLDEMTDKRFIFANKKQTDEYITKTRVLGVTVNVLGMVTSDKRIVINREGAELVDIDKKMLFMNDSGAQTVNITDEFFEAYRRGFLSVFGYKFAISAMRPSSISVGAGCGLPQLLSYLLGINTASKTLNLAAVKLKFTLENEIGILPINVQFNEGDRIYLIRPYCDNYGIPLADSYNNINSYLVNLNARAVIHAIFPVLGDIAQALQKILGNRTTEIDLTANCPKDDKNICSVLIFTPTEVQGKYLGTVKTDREQTPEQF